MTIFYNLLFRSLRMPEVNGIGDVEEGRGYHRSVIAMI